MIWLTLAILCYVLFALNALGDKLLLSNTTLKHPLTYSVSVGIAGALIVLAIPFLGFPSFKSVATLSLAVLSGAIFVFALLPFFAGLKKFQATSVVPTVGAMQPIFALVIGALFFSGTVPLTIELCIALLLLIVGGVLVTAEKHGAVSAEALGLGLCAGFFFALSFILAKQVYLHESLWYGLFWSRLGGAFFAIILFCCFQDSQKEIFAKAPSSNHSDISKTKAGLIFIITQGVGALAGIMQQAAIYTAPVFAVAIVNALQGTQYVFIFIFSLFAAKKFPKAFNDLNAADDTPYKILGVVLILVGIFILFYY